MVVHPFGALGRAMEWEVCSQSSTASHSPSSVSQWSELSGYPGLGVTAVHQTDLTGPFRSQTLTVWRTIMLVIPVLEGPRCGEELEYLFWFSSVVLWDEDLHSKCLLFHESDFQLNLVIENFQKVNNTSLDYYRLPKGLYPQSGGVTVNYLLCSQMANQFHAHKWARFHSSASGKIFKAPIVFLLKKLNFVFEIIVESHAIVRNNAVIYHVYFTQFPKVGTFYKTVVQYHNHGINTAHEPLIFPRYPQLYL